MLKWSLSHSLSFSTYWSCANIGEPQGVSLCPCPCFSPCRAKDHADNTEKKEAEEKRTLQKVATDSCDRGVTRMWRMRAWWRQDLKRYAFFSHSPCRCCSRPNFRHQIAPTSFEKHSFCKETNARAKFNQRQGATWRDSHLLRFCRWFILPKDAPTAVN